MSVAQHLPALLVRAGKAKFPRECQRSPGDNIPKLDPVACFAAPALPFPVPGPVLECLGAGVEAAEDAMRNVVYLEATEPPRSRHTEFRSYCGAEMLKIYTVRR